MELPPETEFVSLIGVDYVRLKTEDGGDIYLTRFGLPFWEQLAPENWHAPSSVATLRRVDATGFIRLNALRLKVAAKVMKKK